MMMSRDKDEAIRCVRYQIRLHLLHVRLYGRIRKLVSLASLILGSTALYGVFKENPAAVGAAGIAVAALSAADLVMNWAERAARHDAWRRRMAGVLARSRHLETADIDEELSDLEGDVDDELASLRIPALNDVLRSNGMESEVREEKGLNWIFRILAA